MTSIVGAVMALGVGSAYANPLVGGPYVQQGSGTANFFASGSPGCPLAFGTATVSNASYTGTLTNGSLTFDFADTSIAGNATFDVNLDGDAGVLGGSFGVNLSSVGSGSGSINSGGLIFETALGSGVGQVDNIGANASNVGPLSCFFQIDNIFINDLRLAGGRRISDRTSSAEVFLPGLQRVSVFDLTSKIDRAIGDRWFRPSPLGPTEYEETPFGPSPVFGAIPIQGGMMVHGKSAGDDFAYPWGAWASFTFSNFEDDFVATAYDADLYAFTVGADFSPWENSVFGLALSYENTDIDTTFNLGGANVDTFSVVPYMGVLLSDAAETDFDLSIDMSAGYGYLDIDQSRLSPVTASPVTSSTNSDRYFFNGNFTGGKAFGNLYVSGTTGLLFARDDLKGFVESDGTAVPGLTADLGRLSVGGDVNYAWGPFVPFASLRYEWDFKSEDLITASVAQPANDDDQFRLGLGVRGYFSERWSGSFDWNTTFDRKNFDENNFNFQIRGEF